VRRLRPTYVWHLFGRRIPQADTRIDAADLDLAQLRMRDFAPRPDRAAGVPVAIPRADLHHVVARQVRVGVDETLLAFEPCLLEEIPQLDDIADRAALIVGVVAQLAMQWGIRRIEELLAAQTIG
jgi:hypothetical protein